MSDSQYDPQSHDSMFSRVLARMDEQNAKLSAILVQVEKTNGRVNRLEVWREVVTAKVALIAAGISGAASFLIWLVQHFTR